MRDTMLGCACVAAGVILLAVGRAAAVIAVETAPVGDVGNAPDATGYGRVDYAYNIGKYEVTAEQYTSFLNAMGGVDTYGLYNTTMAGTQQDSGISRSGEGTVDRPYTYSVDPAFINRPVNNVSFWEACRFANWLSNGQPTGAQGPGTTETGSYTLTAEGIENNTITRNPGATSAVTSEDEWYKAAYYDPATGSYYRYATRSNTLPGRDIFDASGNNANYSTDGFVTPLDGDKYTTVVGEFQNSASPYGTFDQHGNVCEWNETIVRGDPGAPLRGTFRGLRGGMFSQMGGGATDGPGGYYPAAEFPIFGFRVSQVPEPASVTLLALGVAGLLARQRCVVTT